MVMMETEWKFAKVRNAQSICSHEMHLRASAAQIHFIFIMTSFICSNMKRSFPRRLGARSSERQVKCCTLNSMHMVLMCVRVYGANEFASAAIGNRLAHLVAPPFLFGRSHTVCASRHANTLYPSNIIITKQILVIATTLDNKLVVN